MNTFGVERGTTIRFPSTANLFVDSEDRNTALFPTPWYFEITKQQSIANGFFSRIGVTEVVFDWCVNNVINTGLQASFVIDPSGGTPLGVSISTGVYTVAQLIDAMVKRINDVSGTTTVSCIYLPTQETFAFSQPVNLVNTSSYNILTRLELTPLLPVNNRSEFWQIGCPDLRPFTYLDIVCGELTYAQNVKDGTTATVDRDVVVRWYFSDDAPEQLDPYGFPILMGYTRFSRRRLYNPPKQIKWDNNLPVGNLRFQIYDQDGNLVTVPDDDTQVRLTLQLSEN